MKQLAEALCGLEKPLLTCDFFDLNEVFFGEKVNDCLILLILSIKKGRIAAYFFIYIID